MCFSDSVVPGLLWSVVICFRGRNLAGMPNDAAHICSNELEEFGSNPSMPSFVLKSNFFLKAVEL